MGDVSSHRRQTRPVSLTKDLCLQIFDEQRIVLFLLLLLAVVVVASCFVTIEKHVVWCSREIWC